MTARGDAGLDDLEARLWADIQGGDHFPGWLAGRLDLRQALALQVRLLRRRLEAGEQLSGFKVGLTSERARRMLGADERPFGYLMATDRMTQWGVVEGSGLAPTDLDRSLDDVRVRLWEGGEGADGDDLRLDVRGGDEVDDHWSSIARLVAVLAEHGLALEAGHKVITGAMGRFDVAPGQRWRAVYDGVGDVEVRVT